MVSTIRDSSISPTITQVTLGDAIKNAFTAMGYSSGNIIDDYVASNVRNIVYEKTFDATKLFGKIQWRIQITSALAVSQSLQTAWNTSTKIGTNVGTSSNTVTFLATSGIQLKSFQSNSGEHDLVILLQGSSTLMHLGWVRPATFNNCDENAYPLAFQMASGVGSAFKKFYTAGLSPYGNSGTNISFTLLDIPVTTTNHYNQRDTFKALPLMSDAGKGAMAILSNDWAVSGGSGLAVFEQTGDYSVIQPSTTTSGILLK